MQLENRAIRYRIYPTAEQEALIKKTFGCVRFVYNFGINMRQGLYEAEMPSMSGNALNNYCNRVLKEEFPFLREVDKFALTNGIYQLDAAYVNFFEGRSEYPKFKSGKEGRQSYTTNYTNGNVRLMCGPKNTTNGFVVLPKLGKVQAHIHRRPDDGWTIKSATIKRNPAGRYFVSVLFAYPLESGAPRPLPTKENTLGLDYSSPHFYVDSLGRAADMPHYYRKAEARLAKEQRKLSHMCKGSSNYQRQRAKIAKHYEKTADQRKDFCHKLSRKIANSFEAICVEDMDLKAHAQSLSFGKSVMDNGFGMFRTFLRYKLETQGKWFIVIDKWTPSTKTCHECGGYNPDVTLGMDTWTCPCCGRLLDRDWNAALNIRDVGLDTLYKSLDAQVPS